MKQQQTIKERLLAYIRYKHLNTAEFQRAIGVSGAYVQNMVAGINAKKLRTIEEKFPDLDTDWLIYGTGEMIKPVSEADTSTAGMPKDINYIPVFDFLSRCEAGITKSIDNCARWIVAPVRNADVAFVIADDCMQPSIPNGSYALAMECNAKGFVEWGKTYIVEIGRDVVVRKLFPTGSADCVRGIAINSSYPDVEIPVKEIASLWKVTCVITVV